MSEFNFKWMGKNIEELNKEELVVALKFTANSMMDFSNWSRNSEIRELKKEIKIKDEIIEKALRR